MSVERTDYLMWGVQVEPKEVSKRYEELEAEMHDEEGKRFDLVYDGMSGKYAIAGRIICKSGAYEGMGFKLIGGRELDFDYTTFKAVKEAFPEAEAHEFAAYMFSHYH